MNRIDEALSMVMAGKADNAELSLAVRSHVKSLLDQGIAEANFSQKMGWTVGSGLKAGLKLPAIVVQRVGNLARTILNAIVNETSGIVMDFVAEYRANLLTCILSNNPRLVLAFVRTLEKDKEAVELFIEKFSGLGLSVLLQRATEIEAGQAKKVDAREVGKGLAKTIVDELKGKGRVVHTHREEQTEVTTSKGGRRRRTKKVKEDRDAVTPSTAPAIA